MDDFYWIHAGMINKLTAEIPLIVDHARMLSVVDGQEVLGNAQRQKGKAGEIFGQRRMLGIKLIGLTGDIRIARADVRVFINDRRIMPNAGQSNDCRDYENKTGCKRVFTGFRRHENSTRKATLY